MVRLVQVFCIKQGVITAPANLLGSSVGNIFYPKASELVNIGENPKSLLVKSALGIFLFAIWLSILKKVDYAYGMPNVLAQYRVYDSQSSSKKAKMAQENWRLYREVEQLSLLQSLYCFSNYAARAVLRTKFPYIARLIGVLD